jgi:hypothetical protein
VTDDMDLREIADRLAIHQVLMRYCRGVDRGDPELLASVYHEGAKDRHGPFVIDDPRTQFAELVVPRLDALSTVAQHHVTNYIIELHGDTAAVESYFLAYQPTKLEDGREIKSAMGGRYLDRFERRDGRWAIADRTVVVDWSRADVPGDPWPAAEHYAAGGRREGDLSHALFAGLGTPG